MMKYRLNKVIDRHYPKHSYTNFELVQGSNSTEKQKLHPTRRKRHPIGRMKYHSQYALAQEFRKCTNGNLFTPAPASLVQSLTVDPGAVCLEQEKEEEEEEDTICLDNTETVNSEQARVEQDTDSGIDQSEVTADQSKPTEKIKTKTEKEQAAEVKVKQQPSQDDTTEKQRAAEQLDEFFGTEDDGQEKCVEVKEDDSNKLPCQLVDSDSEDSDFEADVITKCTKAEDSLDEADQAPQTCQRVDDISATEIAGEQVTDTITSGSGVLEAAKLSVEQQEKVKAGPVKVENSTISTKEDAKTNSGKDSTEPSEKECKPVDNKSTEVPSIPNKEDVKQTKSPKPDHGKTEDVQTDVHTDVQTDVQTKAEKTEPKQRVEHTVSIPTPVMDSSTEEETSAEKISMEKIDTDSVKSIIKNKPGSGGGLSEKSVSFSKKS